jgi:hypothetical protein
MLPEYPVAGQQKHTIYLGYGTQYVTLSAAVSGGNAANGYTYSWSPATGLPMLQQQRHSKSNRKNYL